MNVIYQMNIILSRKKLKIQGQLPIIVDDLNKVNKDFIFWGFQR